MDENDIRAIAELLYEVIRGEWPVGQDLDEIVLLNTDNGHMTNEALSAQLNMVRRFESYIDPGRILGDPAASLWPKVTR